MTTKCLNLPIICAIRGLHSERASTAAPAQLIRAALNPQTFNYVDQLTQHLKQNFVLHEPGRFVIVPKPFGVSCLGTKQEDGGVFADSVHNRKDNQDIEKKPKHSNDDAVTLTECIPALSRLFNEPKLTFCVGLKRYLSGAIVLPCNNVELENMKKSIKFASRDSSDEANHHHRSLAILLGEPPEKQGELSGYATFQTVGKHTEYVFVPGRAKRRAKSGKFAVEGSMEYRVIATKYGCSLVDFAVSKFARHLPRLMFSHLLSPMAGDVIYGNRMSIIDGGRVLLNPANANRGAPLWFPRELSTRLDTSVTDLRKKMPLYCHVYQTVFPRYGWAIGKPKSEQDVADLVASTPPPPHFMAMVEALEMGDALAKFFRDEDEKELATVGGDDAF